MGSWFRSTGLCFFTAVLTVTAVAESPIVNWRTGSHHDDVVDVQYSNDGTRLVTGDARSVRLWRASDRVLLWSDRSDTAGYYTPVSVSPDNTCFYVGVGQNGADKVEKRSLVNGALIETINTVVIESTDLVAASQDRFYIERDNATYEYRKNGNAWANTWSWSYGNQGGHNSVLDPSGRWLATSTSSETIRVFDTFNRQASPSAVLDFGGNTLRLAFSPNGAYLAAANGSGGVHIISTASWTVLNTIPLSTALAVDWFPGNLYIGVVQKTGTNKVMYRKYNKNGSFVFTSPLLSISDDCNALSISPTTSQAAFGTDHDVRLWRNTNVDQGNLAGHHETVTMLDYSYDDSRCFTAANNEVCAWDTTTGAQRFALSYGSTVRGIGSGGGNLAVAFSNGVALYNQLSGSLTTSVPVAINYDANSTNSVIDVCKSSFGTYGASMVVPSGSSAMLYKASNGSGIQGVNVGANIQRARFSGNGVRLFIGTSGEMHVYRAANLMTPEQVVVLDNWYQFLVNDDGSRFYTVPYSGNIQEYVRNGTTWTRGRILAVGDGNDKCNAALSSDGKLIALSFFDFVGLGGKIEVRRVSNWSLVATYDTNVGRVPYGIAYSRFDQYLGFSDYWNIGALYQSWNSERQADAWTVDLTPATVVGGFSATGRVRLTRPCPAGGLTINLSSGNAAVAQPATNTLTFLEGETQKNFTINTSAVGQATAVSINAKFRRQASGRLLVTP